MSGAAAAVMLWFATVGVVAQPADGDCPPRAALQEAIRARVSDDVVGWIAHYDVETRLEPPVENHVRLRLFDPQARVRLERELTIGDGGCAGAAEGLALIIERYFDHVVWTAGVPLPELDRAPEPPPPRGWGLQAGAGARAAEALVGGVALDGRLAVGAWRALARVRLQPELLRAPVSPLGWVDLWGLPVSVSARWAFGGQRLAFEAGPVVTAATEHATAGGTVPLQSRWRVLVDVGLAAAARLRLGQVWSLVLDADAGLTVRAPGFRAQGREVLAPRRVQVGGLVGVSRDFSWVAR